MKKRTKYLIIVGVLLTIALMTGVSYALWNKTFTQTGNNKVLSDCFQMSFTEDTNSFVNLENTYPIRDEDGSKLKPYTFTVENKCGSNVEYRINLETTKNTTMPEEYIKVMLNSNIKVLTENPLGSVTIPNGRNSYEIESGMISGNSSISKSIRVWMDERVTQSDPGSQGTIFESKITVTGSYIKRYTESILNGTDPVLKNNLVPVVISNDGTVKKADINNKWYSYESKEWANAVILEDESKTYQNNETIPESNIESYFVWIPRYKYQIFNEGNYSGLTTVENKVQEIKVVFEDKNTSVSNGSTVGTWLTHPAFTSFDSNGMWVGKYETGYKGSTSTSTAQANSNDPAKVQIKPNVYSWRGIQVANAHLNSYNYQRDLDSHMMKNTEWGAVAYLQHSKYGSMSSVRINNNSNYVTGYSAVNEPTCGYTESNETCNKYGTTNDITQPYNTNTGYLASTTGNVTGIYDMSGMHTFVFTMMYNQTKTGIITGRSLSDHSGFNGILNCSGCVDQKVINGIDLPSAKYYDLYNFSQDNTDFKNRILGDATGEFGLFYSFGSFKRLISSWYYDQSYFLKFDCPVFTRGNYYVVGKEAGIFSYGGAVGSSKEHVGFRVVLSF